MTYPRRRIIAHVRIAFCAALTFVALATSAQAQLIAHYEFDNNLTDLSDSSGNGHVGTFLDDNTSDAVGPAIVFDGDRSSNVLDVPAGTNYGVDIHAVVPIPDFSATQSFTLASWVKLRSVNTSTTTYVVALGSTGDNAISTLGFTPELHIRGYMESDQPGSNLDQVSVTSDLAVEPSTPWERWHHVAIAYDRAADQARTYLDGVPAGVTDLSLVSDDYNLTWASAKIGTYNVSAGASTSSRIDDLRIYDSALTDSEVLTLYGIARPIPVLRVDRNSGIMTIENTAAANAAMGIQGYSITSTLGALDQSHWIPVTGNYDVNGTGSVDSNDSWTILTAGGVYTDLSEFQFGGDGGLVAIDDGFVISDANGTWLPTSNESDLVAHVTYTDGITEQILVVYEGNGGVPIHRSDLNHDGNVTAADYAIYIANDGTSLSGLTTPQAHQLGDIDDDFDVDINDFFLFFNDYEELNGEGAFAQMLASIPEPSSFLLFTLASLGLGFSRRPRGGRPTAAVRDKIVTSRRGPSTMSSTPRRKSPLRMQSFLLLVAAVSVGMLSTARLAEAAIVGAQIHMEGTDASTLVGVVVVDANGTHGTLGVTDTNTSTELHIADPIKNFGDVTLNLGPTNIPFDQNDGMIFANANQFQYGAVGDRNSIEVQGNLTGAASSIPDQMWISINRVSGSGGEDNADFAFTHFPFADGWIAGHVGEADLDNAPFAAPFLAGNTGKVTVTHVTGLPDAGDSNAFFHISIDGVNPEEDGILFVIGAEGSVNVAHAGVLDDTKWSVVVRDDGNDFATSELGEWSFVYVPYDTRNLVAAGRIDLSGETFSKLNSVGTWTVEGVDYGPDSSIIPPGGTPDAVLDDGRFLIKIPDGQGGFRTDSDGMLMVGVSRVRSESGVTALDDNDVAWEYVPELGGFLVESYDLTGYPLEDTTISFAFYDWDNPIEIPKMEALIRPDTGEVVLYNLTANPIEFNAYQIDSPASALKPGNGDWDSLSDQGYDSMGGGVGQSWDETGGSNATSIGERFLLGSTTLNAGEWVSIGMAYDLGIEDLNMALSYLQLDGNSSQVINGGHVNLVLLGDMDGDGDVDDNDVPLYIQALVNRAAFEANPDATKIDADFIGDFDGNGLLDFGDLNGFSLAVSASGSAESSAVPEPSTCMLFGLTLVGLVGTARRRRRSA